MILPKQAPPVIRKPSGRAATPRAISSFDRQFDDLRLVLDMNCVSGSALRYELVERETYYAPRC